MPERQLAIIKLSPDMQKQVFAMPAVDSAVMDYTIYLATLYYGDEWALCSQTHEDSLLAGFASSQLHLLGTTPYVLLDNGYAIVDWKWAHFQPLSGVHRRVNCWHYYEYAHKGTIPSFSTNPYHFHKLANEEYYLLPVQWQDLTDLTTVWKRDGDIHAEPVEKPEIRYINIIDIEKYGDNKIGYKDVCRKYSTSSYDLMMTSYRLSLEDPKVCGAFIEELDEVQSSYVNTLNTMIKNNDFDKWTH